MLARTAGPPRKPVLAATSSNPPSSASTAHSRPSCTIGLSQPVLARMARKVTAFSVWPSTGATCHKRYRRIMPRGKAQRDGHVEHRPLAGRDPRLHQRLDVVGYRLDAGVGAAAYGIGAEKKRDSEDPTHFPRQGAGFLHRLRDQCRKVSGLHRNTVEDQHDMGYEEPEKDWQQDFDRLAHAAQVEVEEQ